MKIKIKLLSLIITFILIPTISNAVTFRLHTDKTEKTALVGADIFLIEDSAASWATKYTSMTDIATFMSSSGNAHTATTLAANGANCSAGYAPLGVDSSGAVEGCWQITPVAIGAQATLTNSSNLASALSDETGTGYAVFNTLPTFIGENYTSIVSTSTSTGNINLDGVSASNYEYSNGSSTATYTPIFTSRPSSGLVRYITLTVGGGSGVDTMTWTNVTWMGTTGASTTTTNKKSSYACIIDSSITRCSIIAEAY
jgi:hypothetical protein